MEVTPVNGIPRENAYSGTQVAVTTNYIVEGCSWSSKSLQRLSFSLLHATKDSLGLIIIKDRICLLQLQASQKTIIPFKGRSASLLESCRNINVFTGKADGNASMTPPHGGGGNPRYYPDPSRGGRPAYNSQQHGVDVIRSNSGQGGFYKIARYNR